MKLSKILGTLLALLCATQAHAAGSNFTDIQIDTLTPKYGEPITFTFPGITSPSCMIKLSSNVSNFSLEGGAQVKSGKLTFVPMTSVGPVSDEFTLIVGQGIFSERCEGIGKSFTIQVNASHIGFLGTEKFMVEQGKPLKILVNGVAGKSCDGAALDFGDGTPVQQISGPFPIETSHVYAQAGVYKQSVKGTGATCFGSAEAVNNTTVVDATSMTKITTVAAGPDNVDKTIVKMIVYGTSGGSCERALVNWGDGSALEQVSGNFPLHADHTYANGGNQTIKVAAAEGFKCTGQAQTQTYAYPTQAKFSGVTPATANALVNQEVTLELAGSGICQNVSVALGDNLNIINLGAVAFNPYNNFKVPVKVKYATSGSYTLYIKDNGASGCGILNPKVVVGVPLQIVPHLFIPPVVATPPVSTPTKPKAAIPRGKPCAKKNGQQIDPNCVDN
jgi:hypothetical protein